MSLSRALALAGASRLLSFIGKNSFELFILNGFVAVFISPLLARIPFPPLDAFAYAGLAVGMTALHVLAMIILRRALTLLHTGADAIADLLTFGLARKQAA